MSHIILLYHVKRNVFCLFVLVGHYIAATVFQLFCDAQFFQVEEDPGCVLVSVIIYCLQISNLLPNRTTDPGQVNGETFSHEFEITDGGIQNHAETPWDSRCAA